MEDKLIGVYSIYWVHSHLVRQLNLTQRTFQKPDCQLLFFTPMHVAASLSITQCHCSGHTEPGCCSVSACNCWAIVVLTHEQNAVIFICRKQRSSEEKGSLLWHGKDKLIKHAVTAKSASTSSHGLCPFALRKFVLLPFLFASFLVSYKPSVWPQLRLVLLYVSK